MAIWLVLFAMAAGATVLTIVPLWRRTRATAPRADFDAQIYRDQLAEVERDAEAGRITAEQAASSRTEIARRLLAVTESDRSIETDAAPQADDGAGPALGARRRLSLMAALALPVATFGVYLIIGSPHLPGRPAAEVRAAMPAADGHAGRDSAALLAQVAEKLKDRPDDLRGWTLYARSLMQVRRFDEAVAAYRRVTSLAPRDAEMMSSLAEAQIFAADGTVTPAARATLEATLALDAAEPRARFYLGLAESQAGRLDEALTIWIALEADSGPDAPWRTVLAERIAQLAAQRNLSPDQLAARRQQAAEKAGSAPPPPGRMAQGMRGPTEDDVKAAESMSQGDRMEMIRGMVEGLAERLKNEPDDIEGWKRLARSYGVLGEMEKARDAHAHLAAKRPHDVAILSDYAGAIARTMAGDTAIPPELAALGDRILALDPDHSGALWFTGMARAQAGDTDGARERWTRLLNQLDPNGPQHAEVKRSIEALGQ